MMQFLQGIFVGMAPAARPRSSPEPPVLPRWNRTIAPRTDHYDHLMVKRGQVQVSKSTVYTVYLYHHQKKIANSPLIIPS